MSTTDPDTGLLTHVLASPAIPASLWRTWLEHDYPLKLASEIIDLARSGAVVTNEDTQEIVELLRPAGLLYHLGTVFAAQRGLWGFCCLLREKSSPAFRERELTFMRRISPHITAGLRSAALLRNGAARVNPAGTGLDDHAGPQATVGVLVLDDRRTVAFQNQAAAFHLEDLKDVGCKYGEVPSAIGSAVVQLHARHRSGSDNAAVPLEGEVRARGRSGRWLTIRASLSEPDAAGSTSTIVSIVPAQQAEIAGILTRLYGLSRREREVLALVAKGESTKRIAIRLGLSPYTVQQHLGNACDKVGVRSRKALLAKLFFDGYAPHLHVQ